MNKDFKINPNQVFKSILNFQQICLPIQNYKQLNL